MLPYKMWMGTSAEGLIPPYCTGASCFLVAENFGCKAMIYVRDENGLYAANPSSPGSRWTRLKALGLGDSVIEFPGLDLLKSARHVKSVQVINGLIPATFSGPSKASTSAPSSWPARGTP